MVAIINSHIFFQDASHPGSRFWLRTNIRRVYFHQSHITVHVDSCPVQLSSFLTKDTFVVPCVMVTGSVFRQQEVYKIKSFKTFLIRVYGYKVSGLPGYPAVPFHFFTWMKCRLDKQWTSTRRHFQKAQQLCRKFNSVVTVFLIFSLWAILWLPC